MSQITLKCLCKIKFKNKLLKKQGKSCIFQKSPFCGLSGGRNCLYNNQQLSTGIPFSNMISLMHLLDCCLTQQASDLHVSAGTPPAFRQQGDIHYLSETPLSSQEALHLIQASMNARQFETFNQHREVDYTFDLEGRARYRVNAFQQHKGPAAVFRHIPISPPSLSDIAEGPELKALQSLSQLKRGLVLVTGPTGSGKSSTLAALIKEINHGQSGHILTLEDPIEFIHPSQKCLINQRELGHHTFSFESALKSGLRQDPDYILVGEMRDPESIRLVLTAAETGHLVFSSLHTVSAAKAIDRILDAFRGSEKAIVRSMLAESFQGIIAQSLVKKIGGGRMAAYEILLASPAVRNLIREDKISQLYSLMQTHQHLGMQTLDQSLENLVRTRKITPEEAQKQAYYRDQLRIRS